MNKCQNCGSENVKVIPAGVSKKTGKPYNSFMKCEDCGKTSNVSKPVQSGLMPKEDEVLKGLRAIYSVLVEIRDILGLRKDNLDPDRMNFDND